MAFHCGIESIGTQSERERESEDHRPKETPGGSKQFILEIDRMANLCRFAPKPTRNAHGIWRERASKRNIKQWKKHEKTHCLPFYLLFLFSRRFIRFQQKLHSIASCPLHTHCQLSHKRKIEAMNEQRAQDPRKPNRNIDSRFCR